MSEGQINLPSIAGSRGSDYAAMVTMDERMRELQSVQRAICQRDATSKSGNDTDATQSQQTFASSSLKFVSNRTHSFATTFICI